MNALTIRASAKTTNFATHPISDDLCIRHHQRREFVRLRLLQGTPIPRKEMLEIANMYRFSGATVYADVIHFTVDSGGITRHISNAMRKKIKTRDGLICQYCGVANPADGIIEHVVPFFSGGVAKEYNLVYACASCNMRKLRSVWIPNNLDKITDSNPEWREKIIANANHSNRPATVTPQVASELAAMCLRGVPSMGKIQGGRV